MHLSDYSPRQIDDTCIQSLDVEGLRHRLSRLLADLQEARENLNQGPTNSSQPPSSQAPWERGSAANPGDDDGAWVTAVPPDKVEQIAAVHASGRLYADETSGRESRRTPWLWGFTSTTVTLYAIVDRGKALLETELTGFTGGLMMTDGWCTDRVLLHPEWPLTHNEAEQALRHGVIFRKISHGIHTPTGSRTFTVRASVIDTCRQRRHSP